jgi:hypothetical protein
LPPLWRDWSKEKHEEHMSKLFIRFPLKKEHQRGGFTVAEPEEEGAAVTHWLQVTASAHGPY